MIQKASCCAHLQDVQEAMVHAVIGQVLVADGRIVALLEGLRASTHSQQHVARSERTGEQMQAFGREWFSATSGNSTAELASAQSRLYSSCLPDWRLSYWKRQHLRWQLGTGGNVDAWLDDIGTDVGVCCRVAAARLGLGGNVEERLEAEGHAQAVYAQQLQHLQHEASVCSQSSHDAASQRVEACMHGSQGPALCMPMHSFRCQATLLQLQ